MELYDLKYIQLFIFYNNNNLVYLNRRWKNGVPMESLISQSQV
jgi:hypothetical protein